MTPDKEKTLSISGNVFVYGTLATLLAAVVSASALLVFSVYSVHRERDLAIQLSVHSDTLAQCTVEKANYAGRLKTFEALFIHSKKTAVEAAVREFVDQAGSDAKVAELTIDQYQEWLRGR